MPNFLSRSFSSKSKKQTPGTPSQQPDKKSKASQPEATSKFRVLSSAGRASISRPQSSAAPEGQSRSSMPVSTPNRTTDRKAVPTHSQSSPGRRPTSRPTSREVREENIRGKTPVNVNARPLATPSPQPGAMGGNRIQRSASDRPVSYVSINTDHSRPITRPPPSQSQSNSTHQNLRVSTHTPHQHRAMSSRSPHPGAQFRGNNTPVQTPRHSAAFDPLASAESFNSNPAVDRYPRPYVTPKNEFTQPTINGLNPSKSFSRSQSMTSEFAATYSLEGVEGFPDAMPSRATPVPQRRHQGNNSAAQEPVRAASFHGAAVPAWDNGVNGRGNGNIMSGDRGPGGVGMGLSMSGQDGLVGVGRGMGRRGGPGGPPPVPRIPSTFKQPPPPAIRSNPSQPNEMNNYSHYPPARNGRPRNNQSIPGQFSDFDTPPQRTPMPRNNQQSQGPFSDFDTPPQRVPMPQNRRPPPQQHQQQQQQQQQSSYYSHPQRPPPPPNMNGQYPSRPPTRPSTRNGGYPSDANGEDIHDPMPSNSSGEEVYYQDGKGDPQRMMPAALPTPALTPSPPSGSNSNEEQQNSDSDSDNIAKAAQYDGYYHPQHHSHRQYQQIPQHPQGVPMQQRTTSPPSPVSAPRTPPGLDSSSSSSKNSSNSAIAQQIRLSAPIMRGPSGNKAYTKDISLTMEQCMMGHSDTAKDSAMRKTGNWHHSVGCMICGGHGEEGGKPLEDGPASAGKRWLYLCSWCALRVCGECRCKLRDVEDQASAEGQNDCSGRKVKVDLIAFRDAVMADKEKATQEQENAVVDESVDAASSSEVTQNPEATEDVQAITIKEDPQIEASLPPSEKAPSVVEEQQVVEDVPVAAPKVAQLQHTQRPQPPPIVATQSAPIVVEELPKPEPQSSPYAAPPQSSRPPIEENKHLAPARKAIPSRARDSGVILPGGSEESFLSYATAGTRLDDNSSEGRQTPKAELPKVLETPPPRSSSRSQPQAVEYKAAGEVPTLSGPLATPKSVTRVEIIKTVTQPDVTPVSQAPPPAPVVRKPAPQATPRPPSIATTQEELDFMRRAVFAFGYPSRTDSLPPRPPPDTPSKPTDYFAQPLAQSKTLPSVPVEQHSMIQDTRRNTSASPPPAQNPGYYIPALPFEQSQYQNEYRPLEAHQGGGYGDAQARDTGKKAGKKWYKGLFGGK